MSRNESVDDRSHTEFVLRNDSAFDGWFGVVHFQTAVVAPVNVGACFNALGGRVSCAGGKSDDQFLYHKISSTNPASFP